MKHNCLLCFFHGAIYQKIVFKVMVMIQSYHGVLAIINSRYVVKYEQHTSLRVKLLLLQKAKCKQQYINHNLRKIEVVCKYSNILPQQLVLINNLMNLEPDVAFLLSGGMSRSSFQLE